jgi:ABC-2 type transport system permease protein
MNWHGSLALARATLLVWFQGRSFFFLLAFGWMIPPLIYLFVWSTAAGNGSLGGYNQGGFIAYYLVLIMVNQLTYAQTNWTVGDNIRSGNLSLSLLRPLNPLAQVLATELAGKLIYMLFIIPVTVGLGLWLKPDLPLSWGNVLAFIPALLLAWGLRFLWGYWLALLAFWLTRADALLALQDALVFLLAGQVAPQSLLPGVLGSLAGVLPFRYMIGFPVEVLLGRVSGGELLAGFALQCFWLLFSAALTMWLWRTGLKRHLAIGG